MQKVEALTVEDAFEYWETNYCKPEGIIKIRENKRNFENHIIPVLGKMIVNQTSKSHWLSLFDGMGRRVVTGEMLGLMQRTSGSVLTGGLSISTLLNFCDGQMWVWRPPGRIVSYRMKSFALCGMLLMICQPRNKLL